MSRGAGRRYDDVNGLLLLNKPPGMTSNRALQTVRRLLNAKKAGHTGSLDPSATGMLPLCFGEATKVCAFLLDADKTYRVTARLGTATTTGDADGGEVIASAEIPELSFDEWNEIDDPFARAIQSEKDMQAAFKAAYDKLKKMDDISLGLDDFLMATANAHETNLYLLQQASKNS